MKILTFDGGGIRGAFSIRILERLGSPEKDADMLAGTSTGSIIAAALGIGLTPTEILQLYREMCPKVFKADTTHRFKTGWGLWGPRYSSDTLYTFLEGVFGNRTFRDSSKYLLIPSFDLGNPEPYRAKYFNSTQDKDVRLVDAVMASAGSAPLFFPPYSFQGRRYIDGGIATNFPGVSAIAEAINPYRLNQDINKVVVLAIGTGLKPTYVPASKWWGFYKWATPDVTKGDAPPLLDLLLDNHESVVDYQARSLLGARYKRIQADTGKDVSLDDFKDVGYMVSLADSVDLKDANSFLKGFWRTLPKKQALEGENKPKRAFATPAPDPGPQLNS